MTAEGRWGGTRNELETKMEQAIQEAQEETDEQAKVKEQVGTGALGARAAVDIRHGLGKCKREFKIVRRRHTVIGVINIFTKNRMEQT